ncbi:MAG: UDP-2,3-diacylglucosamine diphosphatase [Ramlibacter sp.]|nr:UDP-2,3-diacylglucosamine diphosphatase [Ramlibacter sp.]MBX3657901.1 UDP-2,3-diacylglucosamine diphosphatase [Ramlibacter sp.]MCW5648802.1 UDP-2,3-diacylglucosamine diphosphatase [Ramlibacter sp.]
MSTPTVPRFAELDAPADWRTVDFISDLHLQAGEPATFEAWQRYMHETPADAVFILGDLFEVWVGDDVIQSASARFETRCVAVLRATSARRAVFFMHGNRDFLVGDALATAAGITQLDDPCVLGFHSRRWLLSHGDALCLDDHDYLAFRAQVRTPEWRQSFLARPLAERQAVARTLRDASEQRKRSGAPYADVDPTTARVWLQAAGAQVLVHGHTHRPAEHDLGTGLSRVVLSDWDAAARPPRLQVLRLTPGGLQRLPLG